MADGIRLKLTGDMDVKRALREFREELPKNPMRRAVKKAAQFLADAVSLGAPVGRTGTLLENIAVKVATRKGVTHGRVVINKAAYYWRFLELGWHRGGKFFKYPFIMPRVRPLEQQAAQMVLDEVEAQVRKVQNTIVRTTAGGM